MKRFLPALLIAAIAVSASAADVNIYNDGTKARQAYRTASLEGQPRAMALYASLLCTENGGPVDYPDAFFWHYIAGELGDNYSRVMLYRPRVPESQADAKMDKDAQTALTWIEVVHSGKKLSKEPIYKEGFIKGLEAREQAAEQGDDWSRFYLGSMNFNGDFLNQNYAQALHYYEPIVKNGKLPAPVLALVRDRIAKIHTATSSPLPAKTLRGFSGIAASRAGRTR
ncbi:MAG: hypothetical protein K2L05_04530 [Muribaculaceae bacterium]|nr:hypothetical protein [Muribaculaceae bacterium]